MSEGADFYVKFWGVRGSIACPGEEYQRYGGNTSCLEVRNGEHLLIFDAGTGLRRLGAYLAVNGTPPEGLLGDLFLTHTHHDHIVGLPFFVPMFNPKNRIRIWAGHLGDECDVKDVLRRFMAAPLFPVPPEVFAADVTYHDFRSGEDLEPRPGVKLRTATLNHPNGSTGYRIDSNGKSICYITDTEHKEEGQDPNIVELVRDADLMIYDCSYTDEEYPRFRGWGHSTWQEGVRISDAASVKRLVIFHHDPSHDDDFMDRVAEEAERVRPGTIVAREGDLIRP